MQACTTKGSVGAILSGLFRATESGQDDGKPLICPPLPCLTFPSLAVMEDGLYQWIFSSATAFPPHGRERGPEVNIST